MIQTANRHTSIPRGKATPKSEQPAPQDTDINKQSPGVRFAPASVNALKEGVDWMVNAIRPTLGPKARNVAIAPFYGNNKPPELLDDAATIARRIVEIPDAYTNMGAMLIRHVLWNVHEKVGDGGATTAVIMQALLHEGIRLSAAGWNVMAIRRGIEKGLEQARAALQALKRPVETEADVVGLALAASGDLDLARKLGEIFDTLGPDGHVVVQEGYVPGITHEYIEGAFWNSGWVSSAFANNDLKTEALLINPYVLTARGRIENWEDIAPILNAVAEQQDASLLIIALDVAGTALNLLLSNKDKIRSAAVKAPSYGEYMDAQLEDIAVLTGTRVILNNMGESVAKLRLDELGRARSVTVNRDYFGIVGGHADPKRLRGHIATLREQIRHYDGRDSEELGRLRERLAKLIGGVAILYVSGATPAETTARKERVERTVNTVKQAQVGGIVPGGGTAYIRAAEALQKLDLPREQAVGIDALARALEEPLRVIAHNSGADGGPIVTLAHQQPDGWGYNAMTGEFEDLWAAGVVDPLPVVEAALTNAVSGALMALTTTVTVHRKKPPMETNP